MNVWLIFLLVFCVLSPLVAFRPSRRSLNRMNVRINARRLGVAVYLSRQEWPFWFERDAPIMCPEYSKKRINNKGVWCYWQKKTGEWLNMWQESCPDPYLLEQLNQLPYDVFKVESSPEMIAVYWGELEQAQSLPKITDFLQYNI